MKSIFIRLCALLCVLGVVSCGDDENKNQAAAYDPNKPVVLDSFYPDSGRIAEKVILQGSNFGNDPAKISVYFNQKKAPVVGAAGDMMYAVVPRLPGDTCTVSVVIGNDSLVFAQKFRYKISVSVSTIVGNGSETYKIGAISESQFKSFRLCVDNDGNLFTFSNYNTGTVLKINEEENSVIQLATAAGTGWAACPCVIKEFGVICFPSDNIVTDYYTLDPREGWALKTRTMKYVAGSVLPTNANKKAMAYCEYDGMLYTLYRYGHLVKINPETYETTIIRELPLMESYGLTFHPFNKNILYISYCASNNNSIYTIDITDPDNTYQKITGPINTGHRDGRLELSQFNNPQQIFFDPDGNLYIADAGNHCIRKITVDGMVETVVGIPGKSGWQDGGKEDALFNTPIGVNVDSEGTVYVGDNNNNRVRKLSIE